MKLFIYFFVLIGLIAMSQPNQAQFKDWGTKYGFRGSLLLPENDFANFGFKGNDNTSFDWYKTSWLGEGFFGVELSNVVEISLNGGYGKYAGKAYFDDINTGYGEYESTIIPITVQLRVSPFDMDSWNPYVYAGGGIMNYSIVTKPNASLERGKPTKDDGWAGIFPAGIGAEIALSDNVLLDLGLGAAFAGSYDLDGYRSVTDDYLDSDFNASMGLTFSSENCSSDRDMDGLGKCDEEKVGTDPMNPDSDQDDLTDGDEYLSYKTNPLKADTDMDGLSDAFEITNSKTDPMLEDTDNDKISDGEEINKYKTNALLSDSDKDGLDDGYELMTSKTDPMLDDSDKDGLNDSEEINKFKTNPLVADTDGDGLTDSDEVKNYKTSPLNKDTDSGTIEDFTEIKRGTNPLDADDDIVKIGVPIVLEGITFATGKAEITPESAQILMQSLKTLQTYPEMVVEISGHTDNVGSNSSNQKLSQRRAEAVKGWLVGKGITSDKINAVGYGEDSPRVANDTDENKRLNRRIEFKRTK